ncbi:PREDICTED: testis-expressed sequence 12 protein [Pterocles gutturalis]|uniref:testis-expressed sequence 12 protein n=1 Tax=Pterocles gutturalis TaxID=240206 RepID=UPI00052877AD|nr:PREDICTED: testis-expressed sequence 12 protein [Pterocles gutturalis]
MTSNTQKSDENRSKRKKEMENEASENPQLSSLDKADLAFSEDLQSLHKPEPLEKVLNEMNKEIKNLLSKYGHILSERAAMDASYVQELDGILKEARTIETHLKQKRESLKQRFTVITNTLQS